MVAIGSDAEELDMVPKVLSALANSPVMPHVGRGRTVAEIGPCRVSAHAKSVAARAQAERSDRERPSHAEGRFERLSPSPVSERYYYPLDTPTHVYHLL